MPLRIGTMKLPEATNRIIEASQQIKIRDQEHLSTKFAQLLSRLIVLLGCQLPSSQQFMLMLEFASEKWSKYSISEIELAVKSNLSRELEVKVDFHGHITVEFLSDCLFHYQNLKRKHVLKSKELEDAIQKNLIEQAPITGEILWQKAIEFTTENQSTPLFWPWSKTWEYLLENNLLQEFDLKKRKEIFNMLSEQIKESVRLKKLDAVPMDITRIEAEGSLESIQEACRKHVITKLLRKHLEPK